jgi:2'-5' RNA ligase
METNLRYFIAIVPSAEAKQQIASFRNPDELHVTVSYLGPKSAQEVEDIKMKLYSLAQSSVGFNVKSTGYSTFDNGKYPHLSVDGGPRFIDFYNKIKNNIGTAEKQTTFAPHITVGTKDFVPQGNDVSFDVRSVVLYQVNPGGTYTPVASFPLKDETLIDKIKDFFGGSRLGKFFGLASAFIPR